MLNQVILVGKVVKKGIHTVTIKVNDEKVLIRIPQEMEEAVEQVEVGNTIGVKAELLSDGMSFLDVWAQKMTFIKA